MNGPDQQGLRVLVVEDEFLVAILLQDALEEMGYQVIGPSSSVATALIAAEQEGCDAAILDINLHGEMVFPVARVLRERGIPFLFLSGYSRASLPEEFSSQKRLEKPVPLAALEKALAELKIHPTV